MPSMKKVIIVTGASSGMGVSFARQLAAESADFRRKGKEESASDEIWLIARRIDKLNETAELISEDAKAYRNKYDTYDEMYPETKVFSMDITGSQGAENMKQLFLNTHERDQLGNDPQTSGLRIMVLVNNAGFGTYGEFISTSTKREMEMIDLNCTSLTGITGYALKYMKEKSRIINTASLAAYAPLGNFAVYGATKAYVLSFSAALRAELKGRGINVTALCPGSVSTEFANVASNGARREVKNGLDPDVTVADCIKASRKNKMVSMHYFKWKFKAFFSGIAGRRAAAAFTYKFNKRPSKPFND